MVIVTWLFFPLTWYLKYEKEEQLRGSARTDWRRNCTGHSTASSSDDLH